MMPHTLLPLTKSPPKAAKIPPPAENAKPLSPRKAKQKLKANELRTLEFTDKDHINILPGNFDECQSNGTGTMQDILLFDQKLRDAVPTAHSPIPKISASEWAIPKEHQHHPRSPSEHQQYTLLASNKISFEILTSDRGQRVISSLVKQWEMDKFSDNGRSLWTIVETFFTSLPYVFAHEDEIHSKVLVRYVAALSSLKDVIIQGLFCANPSAAMAITATLTPTHHEKIPLYWYCHQLEREIQSLKNSTSDQSWEMVHSSEIGLLQESTANVLLNFWKLPKRERLAFLAQVFSNVTEIETDLVRVLLENSTFILQRVLEDLGYELKPNRIQPKLSTIGAVVSMSVQASNQARQLHKWRNHMRHRSENLEPIQVRHKGIQVNGGSEADDHLGALEAIPPPPRTPIRIRRSIISNDKSLKMVLMQDYQPFGKKDHHHLLTKDQWTISTYTENLVHHLDLFLESAHDSKNVPTEVILLASLLLEWLLFEKTRAISNGKDMEMDIVESPHFQQSVYSLMELLKTQSDEKVPETIRTLASTLQDFIVSKKLPLSPDTVPRVESSASRELTPADMRAFLRNGFSGDVVNLILSISNEEQAKERDSQTLLLIEQLERSMVGKLQDHRNNSAGFGQNSSGNAASGSSSTVIKTLMDQMKALLIDNSDGKVNEQKASALLLDFVTSIQQKDNGTRQNERANMLNVDSLCSVLEKKLELQLQAGPLDKATRNQIGHLQKFVNKLIPQEVALASTQQPVVPPIIVPKTNNIPELVQLLEQALAKKDVIDTATASTLEALHVVLMKTQSKMNGQPFDICVSTLVESLQASGDEKLEEFCSGIDDMALSLKAILASCVEANEILHLQPNLVDKPSPALTHGNIDDVINDSRIDAIPLFIINLSKKLKTMSDTSQQKKSTHHQTIKSEASQHHSSVGGNTTSSREDIPPSRVRKAAAAISGLFSNPLWENTKLKKPNVLGISANELSEMYIENKTVLNVGTVQKLIYQIYRERYECNLTEQDNPNTTQFIDFVYDWYLRKYGLRKLAMQHLAKLLLSLKKQKKKSKKALLFCRFLGLFPPLFDYSALNFAMGLLNVWTNGTFTVNSSNNRVQISSLNQILDDGYDRRFGPFCSTQFVKERLNRNACADDPTSIDQDMALEIALEEYVKMKTNVESMLDDIYKAGDMNADDKMGFDEFATVVRNLAPCVSDREIVKMFKEALLDSSFDTVTRQRFVNVIIDQGVLSSRVNKFKAPSGTTNSPAFPEYENEQFELLEETWRAHESEIVKVIENIPHKETSVSLLLRVRILNMILAKRIDSETAWLSHRMILRDVDRFKDLNENAISEIKKKEAYFKEAVSRITTSRFGLFREGIKSTPDASAQKNEKRPQSTGVVEFVQTMDENIEKVDDSKEDEVVDIARIEDTLRTEMLNLADETSDGNALESQLDVYDDAVKKVRRVSMMKANRAMRKLTAVMKMSKLVGAQFSNTSASSEMSDDAIDDED